MNNSFFHPPGHGLIIILSHINYAKAAFHYALSLQIPSPSSKHLSCRILLSAYAIFSPRYRLNTFSHACRMIFVNNSPKPKRLIENHGTPSDEIAGD